ncbi:FxSxx-COOH system tetratricopeptide repeat protein [Streptomyces sp. MBT33]|uniref:FxSxx-COOH system tetratricopeptide repeat protein n=1 Tax=Streptomyces sp. MBT33 TaxID=1488363 RepID=UPI0019094337|nr:FxSxx-COOH system tetratricopeptide repeat protein [Streptomyces sp. MBT33]MBK3640661.1 TIR domain-containing protein [Streptomyces sp. MBT33]
MAVGDRATFFISYARDDQAWAEWMAWQLQDAGHEVWLDTWSLLPGDVIEDAMLTAVRASETVLVLVSSSYARSRHAMAELETAYAAEKRVIPVLLDDGPFPYGLDSLRAWPSLRIAGMADRDARDALLHAVAPDRPPVGGRLRRFGATSPRLPGSRPAVWSVPERYDQFVGRVDLLKQLREALTRRSRAALVGDPGMGKTQLAIEYAYRFAGEYELVWWIGPGQGSVAAQLADLGVRLGIGHLPLGEAARAVTAELRTRNRWLLIFDDVLPADGPPKELMRDTGNGQLLVVSRDRNWDWAGAGERVEVGPLTREESSALLRMLAPSLSDREAEVVAADIGTTPLAVGMAANSLSGGISVGLYLEALSAEGPAGDPPQGLRHAVRLGVERLAAEDPSAVALLSACSLLAPQPFRLRDCVRVPDWTPQSMAVLLRDARVREKALRAVNRYELGQGGDGVLYIHPAAHSALRDLLSPIDHATAALAAQALLVAALPSQHAPQEAWAPLLPHLLTVAPQDLTRREGLTAACHGCVRLVQDGEAPTAVPRLSELREASQSLFGADDATTMSITSYLVDALQAAGEPEAALPPATAFLAWARRAVGEGEPVTLEAAAQLTALLSQAGDAGTALDLGMNTRERLRAVLGPDHPLTLSLSATLLEPLRALGRKREAETLGEDTLSRQRRVLGQDHAHTLRTAALLAVLHADRDDLERARHLREDIFHGLARTLGPSDPATLRAVAPLAMLLIRDSRPEEAEQLLFASHQRQMETLGAYHVDTLRTSWLLAAAHLEAYDFDAAVTWARRTHETQLRILGSDHPDTRDTAGLLAVCLQKTGRSDEARSVLRDSNLDGSELPDKNQVIAQMTDNWYRLTDDLPEERVRSTTRPPLQSESRSTRAPASRPGTQCVLVSHAEADRVWADWVTFELEQLGYEVVTEAEDTHLGWPLSRESDIVLVLVSPSYLASMTVTAWTSEEWTALMRDDARGGPRLVALFVRPVEPDRLPPKLRSRITPALYDLDSDAARDLLRFTLDEPTHPTRPPVFPGTSGPDDDGQALLTRRLVNALERSAVVQGLDDFRTVTAPLGIVVREAVSPRTRLWEAVRSLRARPGGLAQLVDALEAREPGSLAVAEARRIVDEIEHGRAPR